MNTHFQRPDRIADPLYVITPVFNPIRFRSRWRLHEDFVKRAEESGSIHYTIEAAFGDRDHVVTYAGDPRHIQLRTSHELWLKENLINIAVSRLPADWKYVAWVDGDVTFVRDDWANETIHQLQHYAAVQMWSQYQDISPNHELIGSNRSFADCFLNGGNQQVLVPARQEYRRRPTPRRGYPGAPGLAWAMRRDAWDALGGLIDYCILGACDWYMAHALVGKLGDVVRPEYSARYVARMMEWQTRAEQHVRRNVGVVPGLALHHWHGPKRNRQYGTRDQVLIDSNFDPDIDLKRDWQGCYQLTERSIELRDGIRAYFRQRNEDSIDL